MIKKIINWLLSNFLKKQAKVQRVIQAHNISTAKSVGLIYSSNDQEAVKEVTEFAQRLKLHNINVDTLGYANDRKSEGSIGYSVFNNKSLNFFNKPQSSVVSSFLAKKYDILVYVCTSPIVPLQYIVAESCAQFKIGPYISEYTDCFDFMIQIENGTSIKTFVSKIEFYLHNLNKNAA